jgi:hypothetical protein
MPPPLPPLGSLAQPPSLRHLHHRLHHFRLHLRLRRLPRPTAHRAFTTARPSPAAARPTRSKPATLAQPDRFRPPSHPARRPAARSRKRLYFGAETTPEQKAAFDSKQYPYSFPPPETFMHWFLTTRSVHIWISLVRHSARSPTTPSQTNPPPRAASRSSAPSSPTANSTAATATRSSCPAARSC